MTATSERKRNGARPYRALKLIACVLALLVLVLFLGAFFLRGEFKRGIVSTLQKHFQGNVQFQQLDVFVFPHIGAVAHGVIVTTKENPDPPLITIRELTISANPLALLLRHVSSVSLDGLQIRVPPRPPGSQPPTGVWSGRRVHFVLVIDEIVASDSLLETLPGGSGHVPRDFVIHQLKLHSFSFENPSPFVVSLTNPIPAGEIDAVGQFGPWKTDQPADTPVSGTFHYSHVDFSSIMGLSGMMSSQGSYSGTIDHINVQGTTDMPDFALAVAGNSMPLTTRYIAVVDGTTGNTYLNSVDAKLGNSPIHVSGEIVGIPGVPGRKITLQATSSNARAEDLIHLAVKGSAPLLGVVNLRTKIEIPPIPKGQDAAELMELDGQFEINHARFTDASLQGKVDALSRAGQGQPKDNDIQDVPFELRGKFVVTKGAVQIAQTNFDLPGVSVQVEGSYGLENSSLDFTGRLGLDAKASQATSGIKSVLLRIVDPLFDRHGKGFSISFHVGGTRSHPLIRPGT